jgi:septum formation protein
MKDKIILASASPRRKKILEEMELCFEVVIADVNEVHMDDNPAGTVSENAERKCNEVSSGNPHSIVIAADTVAVFGGRCLGKPQSMAAAAAMLQSFSDKSQTVYTGVALHLPQEERKAAICRVEKSVVHFRELSDSIIAEYLSLVNPLDKAGGYDIDQHGELIISGYEGSWTNIMGLPKEVIAEYLCR